MAGASSRQRARYRSLVVPTWHTSSAGSAASSRYMVNSDVPGGVFNTHGSSAVPVPLITVLLSLCRFGWSWRHGRAWRRVWKPGAMHIGQTARRTRTITEHDIELFTELTGDRNPLHYDADAAARSRFGGLIVQGGVTSGLLNALVAEDLPGPGSVFLHVDWSFRAPVRPGDEITAEAEVLDVRADKPICALRTMITNQDNTVVLDGTALVYREPLS